MITSFTAGRRFERLLLFSAPLTFAALVLLFIASATNSQADKVRAKCYLQAADALSDSKESLEKEWNKDQPLSDPTNQSNYKFSIDMALSHGLMPELIDCYQSMGKEVDKRSHASPDDVINLLQKDAKTLLSTPLEFFGIEIPEAATINVSGMNIKIEMTPITIILQITLAPLLILWLASIYGTRLREIQFISAATDINEVFPHAINAYPVGTLQPARKKHWFNARRTILIALWYFLIRVGFLLVFVGPPLTAYVLSLFLLHMYQDFFTFMILTALILMVAIGPFLLEASALHFWKIFPPAKKPN